MDTLFESRNADSKLVTSFIAVIEITGAAARLRRNRLITQRGFSQLLARFNEDQSQALELIPVSESIQRAAVRVARDYGLRAADSIHLATMIDLNSAAQAVGVRFVIVAADKALQKAAERERIGLLDPEQDDSLLLLKQSLE